MKHLIFIAITLFGTSLCHKAFSQETADEYLTSAIQNLNIGYHYYAIDDLDSAIRLFKNNKEKLAIAYCYLATANDGVALYPEAIEDCKTSLKFNGSKLQAYMQLGHVYDDLYKYKKAACYYLKAISYCNNDKPTLSKLYTDRTECEMNLGNYPKAMYDDSMAINCDSTYFWAYVKRAYIYFKQNKYDAATKVAINASGKVLNYLKNDTESLVIAYNALGYTLTHCRSLNAAIHNFNMALALDPKLGKSYQAIGELYWNMGIAYEDSGLYQQAINYLTQAVSFYKDNADDDLYTIYVSIGFNADRLKHYQEAIDDENQAIAVDPENPSAFFIRGRTYFLMHEEANANSDFNKCLDRYVLFIADDTKALAHFYLGDTAKATRLMNRITKRTNIPREDLAGNYYGMACFKSLMNKPQKPSSI